MATKVFGLSSNDGTTERMLVSSVFRFGISCFGAALIRTCSNERIDLLFHELKGEEAFFQQPLWPVSGKQAQLRLLNDFKIASCICLHAFDLGSAAFKDFASF